MAKKENTLSPMMQQYLEIKKKYSDTLLFFRLGDFYEMFFDDAKTAAQELDLVLTGRDCGLEERAPMCGVPFHSVDSYIAKLVSRGYKIAICEQMEDPSTTKNIVKRDVVRIITPGTVIEDDILDDGTNNYLCSICASDDEIGLCFADVSTGEFNITNIDLEDAQNKLKNQFATYMPKEFIINSKALDYLCIKEYAKRTSSSIEVLDDEIFDFNSASSVIVETLNKEEIGALNVGHSEVAVSALGATISYMKLTRCTDKIEPPTDIDYYTDDRYMLLNAGARRNLELSRSMMSGDKKLSLLWVIDKTKTAMGKRMLKSWVEKPLMNVAHISKRQNAVAELADNPMTLDSIRNALSGVNDIERLITRIVYGTVNGKELKSLEQTIFNLPLVKDCLLSANSGMLREIYSDIDLLGDVQNLIANSITDNPPNTLREGNIIRKGYNEELDELINIQENGSDVLASIEKAEKEKTGIPKLRIAYNRVFGYFIEVTNSYKDLVPDNYIRKQTLTNCERYITQELKELESKIIGAKEHSIALEYQLFVEIRESVAAQIGRIRQTAKALATLDTIASLAFVAVQNNYICPIVNTQGIIDIKDGRHPVVETLLDGAPFVPNDTYLDMDNNICAIITGPNMAGKSTYMRQIALITLLAQIGSFVPARTATIGVVDAIYTRVGASDDLATGQSTFMVEMNEVADILKNATPNSLIILDEIGRGTSTFDGMSIARAVLEYVCKKKTLGAKTLFATHYHELTAMEGILDGVKNYSIAVKKRGDDITFLRKIVRGGADKSFGIEVAKLAGVPNFVLKRAKLILKELEANATPIEFKAEDDSYEQEEEVQYNFSANGQKEIIEILKSVDVNNLTPIEAMQTLNELKTKAQEL